VAGTTSQVTLVVHACAAFNPCQVGYIYDVKASALDAAIYGGFLSSTAGHANVKIVAYGQSYFTPWNGLTAAQSMLQSHLVVEGLLKAIRTGVPRAAVDPVAYLPNGGVATRSDSGQFHAEWPG
jgi:hypothetical protein